jgi:hypothetical protein
MATDMECAKDLAKLDSQDNPLAHQPINLLINDMNDLILVLLPIISSGILNFSINFGTSYIQTITAGKSKINVLA